MSGFSILLSPFEISNTAGSWLLVSISVSVNSSLKSFVDCNVSVRKKLETTLRNKSEIKNLNSFYNMEMVLESEMLRQIRAYSLQPHEHPHKVVGQATYRFDPKSKKTILMRDKEEANDYRYFPELNLPPILTDEYIAFIRATLPELPYQRFKRYLAE